MIASRVVDPATANAPAGVVDEARALAESAAGRAGVTIRPLVELRDLERAAWLAAEVWRSPDTRALEVSLMRALEHSGNFVVGAFDGEHLTGLSVGFRTGEPARGLHSHMTCADPRRTNGGLGRALKLNQRAWALGQGLRTITWTFDPLIGRNAYFNMAKLGATVESYQPNFYGAMSDGVNAGVESDRLLMSWDLLAPNVDESVQDFVPTTGSLILEVADSGAPTSAAARTKRVGCQIPQDIAALRAEDPDLARRWRRDLRAALLQALDTGYEIVGFSRASYYVLDLLADRTKPASEGE